MSRPQLFRYCLFSFAMLAAGAAQAESFGYYGEKGPDFWADLDAANAACGAGIMQSPVNLEEQRVYPHLNFKYGDSEGEIFNNGHTVEVEVDGENTLYLGGKSYLLKQFHFHTPSEHRIKGRGYDMEMHLVHGSDDGENVVVGVFLKRGDSSHALEQIFVAMQDIPLGETDSTKHAIAGEFNPSDFLPASKKHMRYLGSLTTPACTEGVKWVIMLQPVTVLDEDMAQFAARISFNARYIQRNVPNKP